MIKLNDNVLIDECALLAVYRQDGADNISFWFSGNNSPLVLQSTCPSAQFERLARLLCSDHDPGIDLDSFDSDERDECAELLTNGWRYITRDVLGVHAFEAKPCKVGAYWHLGDAGSCCRVDGDFAALPDDKVLDLAEGKLI